jgi:hypothetical protein
MIFTISNLDTAVQNQKKFILKLPIIVLKILGDKVEEIGNCQKCGKSHNSCRLVRCVKTKELICKDCCVRMNGSAFEACINWRMCWLPTFI